MLEDKIPNPGSEAMLWIKEVEMVDSVDELKSSRSIEGRISRILTFCFSNFKKKVSLEEQKAQKEDRFRRGRQIAYMIYDFFRDLHISTNYVLHMEKVFSIVRQRYGLSPMDQMKNLDVNTAFWSFF